MNLVSHSYYVDLSCFCKAFGKQYSIGSSGIFSFTHLLIELNILLFSRVFGKLLPAKLFGKLVLHNNYVDRNVVS